MTTMELTILAALAAVILLFIVGIVLWQKQSTSQQDALQEAVKLLQEIESTLKAFTTEQALPEEPVRNKEDGQQELALENTGETETTAQTEKAEEQEQEAPPAQEEAEPAEAARGEQMEEARPPRESGEAEAPPDNREGEEAFTDEAEELEENTADGEPAHEAELLTERLAAELQELQALQKTQEAREAQDALAALETLETEENDKDEMEEPAASGRESRIRESAIYSAIYNVGKSGKAYTEEELERLIRE